MSMKVTREAYAQLIAGDLAWLDAQPRTLERDHVRAIVSESIDWHYPTKEMLTVGAQAIWDNNHKGSDHELVSKIFDAIHNIGRVSP